MHHNSKHILVVDDNENLLEIIKFTLESEGFRVSIAQEGKAALNIFNQDNPDLVILDIILPGLSGYEVLKSIRKLSKVPVLILTGIIDSETASQTLRLGADDYIRKPFIPNEVVARVRAKLRKIV